MVSRDEFSTECISENSSPSCKSAAAALQEAEKSQSRSRDMNLAPGSDCQFSVYICGDKPAIDSVHAAIVSMGPGNKGMVELVKEELTHETSASLCRETDMFSRGHSMCRQRGLLVLAVLGHQGELCIRFGRMCASSGSAWALIRFWWDYCEVGPLVLPGETACFHCLALRVLAATEDPSRAHEAPQGSASFTRQTEKKDLPRSLLHLGASLLANELETYIRSGCATGIHNGLWSIRHVPLLVRHHRLLRVPGCPTCTLGRAHLLKL